MTPEQLEIVNDLIDAGYGTEWERQFLKDLKEKKADFPLSPKQAGKLAQIAEEREFGRAPRF